MNTKEAQAIGKQVAGYLRVAEPELALGCLADTLARPTPFRLLDVIGRQIGAEPLEAVNPLLEWIAAGRTEGGWVVIASALGCQFDRDLTGALEQSRRFTAAAQVWYATDILGERVPGPGLLYNFDRTLAILAPWREDPNHWVRRTLGVAAHFWGKRRRGAAEFASQAQRLLDFLEPLFEERNLDAVKGVGWGLKTLGRTYPNLVTEWLLAQRARPHRALMLRKALTFLPGEQRQRVLAGLAGEANGNL